MAGLGLGDAPAHWTPLQRQQPAVQFLQARAVPNTDDRRLGQPLEQQRQQAELAVDVPAWKQSAWPGVTR